MRYRQLALQRRTDEHVDRVAKRDHGLRHADGLGLGNLRIQEALTAAVMNLNKLWRWQDRLASRPVPVSLESMATEYHGAEPTLQAPQSSNEAAYNLLSGCLTVRASPTVADHDRLPTPAWRSVDRPQDVLKQAFLDTTVSALTTSGPGIPGAIGATTGLRRRSSVHRMPAATPDLLTTGERRIDGGVSGARERVDVGSPAVCVHPCRRPLGMSSLLRPASLPSWAVETHIRSGPVFGGACQSIQRGGAGLQKQS